MRKKGQRREAKRDIPRDPYPAVKQLLRKEVHYACPVPGCGRPLLEWHHFDPEWKKKHHHNPDGMIALCTLCHPRADRGTWTKEELRSFKRNPAPLGLIRETFGWSERSVLYRLGGSYAVDCAAGALAVNDRRVLWDERSAEGRLLFSLDFFGERGQCLLQISQNCLSVDASSIWDLSLNTGATYLKLWLGERKPGIELQFRRLSIEQLREIMNKDVQQSEKVAEKLLANSPWADLDFPSGGQEGRGNSPLLEYVSDNCVDSDGTVTLIDIAQARFYARNGSLIEVTASGIRSPDGSRWVKCDAFNCGGYGFNLL
jgi:hypothetical protein